MKNRIKSWQNQKGIALIYIAITLTTMCLFTGLAVDGGRAYVVKAQLSKAVDGAALGAARALNSGDPRGEAERIFKANFPLGFMGTSSVTDPTADPSFFASHTDTSTGINTVNVTASAIMPTTFMKLGNINNVTVRSAGEAQRRMVDLSIVLDVSSSIGSQWGAVRDATREFINAFDATNDRLSLTLFSTGAQVPFPMPISRGFDKTGLVNAVPSSLPNGSTLMTEGLYRGWDQLRTVPTGQQSGLRIIVLFTDGASNGVPARWGGTGAVATSIRTADFPDRGDPDHQTWNNPAVSGVIQTNAISGTQMLSPPISLTFDATSYTGMQSTTTVNTGIPAAQAAYRYMPAASWHTQHNSSGIPTTFPLVTNALNVNGAPQSSRRTLIPDVTGGYPTTLWNVNNAARNLLEIIADAARTDTGGDYPVRIYTIGMGNLAHLLLGTMPETPESILQRIANDPVSPDHNSAQLDGKYFYAATAADVGPAFQGIQNQILRLSK